MKKMRVPFSQLPWQYGDIDWPNAMHNTFERCDFTLGKEVDLFEGAVAKWLGANHVVAVNSGTDAIKLALGKLHGGEVIVPGNTFAATAGAVIEAGGVPVFCDVGDDYTMDPADAAKRVTKKTSAIVPVHLCGHPCDMPALETIESSERADPRHVPVVQDAAQAFGARFPNAEHPWRDGASVGSYGLRVAFSLHPLKVFNVPGDGGFITTTASSLFLDELLNKAEKWRLLRNHGLADRDTVERFGVNSRLNTLCAAVARRQLPLVKGWIRRRRQIASMYDSALSGIDEIHVPPRRGDPSFHLYVVQAWKRDKLLAHLIASGIEAKVHYPVPLHLQPASKPYYRGPLPNVERQAKHIISLPCHQYLTDDQVWHVVERIGAFYHPAKRRRPSKP